MATYLILNLTFIIAILGVLRLRTFPHTQHWLPALVILLILTAVFDNLLIFFSVIDYNADKLLGVYVGRAPIEDFFYPVLAVFLIPTLWHRLGKNHVK